MGFEKAELLGYTDEQYKNIVEALVHEGFKEKELTEMMRGEGMLQFSGLTFENYYVTKYQRESLGKKGISDELFGSKEAKRLFKLFAEDIDDGSVDWHGAARDYRRYKKNSKS